MLILNEPFCNEKFIEVNTLEDIKNSPSNFTLIFHYNNNNLDLYKFCNVNNIEYAVKVDIIKELIFIANFKAKYAFIDNMETATEMQKIAENYLLDTKIIYLANSLDEIEKIAKLGIDGIKLKENK